MFSGLLNILWAVMASVMDLILNIYRAANPLIRQSELWFVLFMFNV